MKILQKCLANFVFVFLLIGLSACVTIAPKPLEDKSLAPDRTTPPQYSQFNDGVIGYVLEGKTVYIDELKKGQKLNGSIIKIIITPAKREEYNRLVEKYKLQLEDQENLIVAKDSGITSFVDKYGNKVFAIDATASVVFAIFKRWEREQRPEDSIWLKIKNSLKA